MTELSALWLPILLSAVVVFVMSSVIHMLSPWHKSDYPKAPNEDKIRDAIRPLAIPHGDYMIPRPSSRADLRSPEFTEKMKTGPVMILTVMPNGLVSMGGKAPYIQVFRFAGTTAFIAYSVALWQMSIWYRRAWSTTIKATVDGLIYALLTAGVFGWLWPR
jgi:hypothetical protein